MGFDVRKEDADALAAWVKAFAVGMQRNLEDVAAAALALGEVDDFTGAAADSSRAYWEEVHVPILKGLDAVVRDLYSRYGEYMAVLDGVDAARDAWLEYDALTRAEADFGGLPGDVAGFSSSLATVLEDIRDVIDLPAPSEAALTEELSDLACLPRAHRDTMEGAEDFYAASAEGLGELLSQLARAIGYAGSVGSFASYAPGSAQSRPWAGGLAAVTEASRAFSAARSESAKAAYAAAANRDQHRFDKAAQDLIDDGRADIITGLGSLIVGGLAIVFTGTAAVPFVAPLLTFGTVQIIEGAQDAWHGASGDLGAAAWNPIRDTIFLGNQEVYDKGYGVASVFAALGPSAWSALGAAKSAGSSLSQVVPVFTKDFTKDLVKGAGHDALAEGAFALVGDQAIDGLGLGEKTTAALKDSGRDTLSGLSSGIGDKLSTGFNVNGAPSADASKADVSSPSNVPKTSFPGADGEVTIVGAGASPDATGVGIGTEPGAAWKFSGAEGTMGSTQKLVDPKAGAGARP